MNVRLNSPRALVLALSAAGVIGAVGAGAYTSANAVNTPAPAVAAPMVTMPDFSTITTRNGPAVVNISVTGTMKTSMEGVAGIPGMGPDDPMFEFFRRFQGQMGPRGNSRSSARCRCADRVRASS